MRRWVASVVGLVFLFFLPSRARAGGSDTPTLNSARQLGMGGAAIGYVDDSSSLFLNPAGLAGVNRGDILLSLGMKRATVSGTVVAGSDPVFGDNGVSIDSETSTAPIFFLGGGARVTDWLVLGAGVFPTALGGARYVYEDLMGEVYEDRAVSLVLETSVGAAIDFEPWGLAGLRLGVTWRPTFVSLTQEREFGGVSFRLTGWDYRGFRVGAQYQPIEELELGFTWRTRITASISDPSAEVTFAPLPPVDAQVESELYLPDRIGIGVRGRIGPVAIATDLEITFSSNNVTQPFVINDSITVEQVQAWENEYTWRIGVEYRVAAEKLPLRLGYIYDGITTDIHYPSAFGTPPTATHVITAGVGYDHEGYSVNLAYAHRRGEVEVTMANPSAGDPGYVQPCAPLCGGDGSHGLASNELYVDFSRSF